MPGPPSGNAPEIAGGAELHREPKPVVVSAAKRDETAVAVIEMEVSSEIRRVGFTMEPVVLRRCSSVKNPTGIEISFRLGLQQL
jgi:hypothetical protein